MTDPEYTVFPVDENIVFRIEVTDKEVIDINNREQLIRKCVDHVQAKYHDFTIMADLGEVMKPNWGDILSVQFTPVIARLSFEISITCRLEKESL